MIEAWKKHCIKKIQLSFIRALKINLNRGNFKTNADFNDTQVANQT